MVDYFDRRIVSLHDDDDLSETELILKQTLRTPVRKLPLATFRQHEKQGSESDGEDSDQLTNQSVGGVQRARQLASENSADTLPAVYGGLFAVAEYFTRSFDAIKGKFFEKVIAAEESTKRLDVDRDLGSLLEYLLEPNLWWKDLSYTRESLSDEEADLLQSLSPAELDLEEDHMQANADATLFYEEDNTLIFGEHRTSVVSGGTTARPSLMRKPRALVRELTRSTDVVTIPTDLAEWYDIEEGAHTLASALKAAGVHNIHIHIGILFDESRLPAKWDNDPQQSTSRRLIREFKADFLGEETGAVMNVDLDPSDLRLEFDVPVESSSDELIHVHLSFLYGDTYINTLYTGSLDGVGKNGSPEAFDSPTGLREIISENEADDLWLGFSVAERENKVFEMSADNSNNAMEIADMILSDDGLTDRLIAFRDLCRNGTREAVDKELLAFATDLAEQYDENRDNLWAEWVYGDGTHHYLRDVAIQVLIYDVLSRPIFLRRFPESTPPEEDEQGEKIEKEPELSDIRHSFEQYLFSIDSSTRKKRDIYRVVRNLTRYVQSRTKNPVDEDEEVDWTSAPTKSEIGDLLGIRTPTRTLRSMSNGGKTHYGGILAEQDGKFAVPAPIAYRMGSFMCDLPPSVQSKASTQQSTLD